MKFSKKVFEIIDSVENLDNGFEDILELSKLITQLYSYMVDNHILLRIYKLLLIEDRGDFKWEL